MKKMKYLYSILFCMLGVLFTQQHAYGQAEDCGDAIQICPRIFPNPSATAGTGADDDFFNNPFDGSDYTLDDGCLFGENGSNWYWVEVTQSGNLAFSVQGVDAAGATADIDVAFWGPYGSSIAGCTTGDSPARCSYAGSGLGLEMVAGAGDTSEGSGGDGQVEPIPTIAGEFYLIYVDNFNAGFASGAIEISITCGAANTADYACPEATTCSDCASATCPTSEIGTFASGADALATFTSCAEYAIPWITSGGTFEQCYTINSGADGNFGAIQQVQTTSSAGSTCGTDVVATRTFTLTLLSDACPGTAITPTTANGGGSGTFNPEWEGLTPNTDYRLCLQTTMPTGVDPCTDEVCNVNATCLDIYRLPVPVMVTCAQTCADVAANDCGVDVSYFDATAQSAAGGTNPVYDNDPFNGACQDYSGAGGLPTNGGEVYTHCTQWTATLPDAFFPTGEGVAGTNFGCFGTNTITIFDAATCAAIPGVVQPDAATATAGSITGLTIGTTYVICQELDYGMPLDISGAPCTPLTGDVLNLFCANVVEFGTPPPPPCDQVYEFAADDICSGDAPTFAIQPGCDPGTLDQFGIEIDLDFYVYAPGGVPGEAPATFDPTGGLAASYNFPITGDIPDLTNIGGVGGTWNGTICADLVGGVLINNTCAPMVVTYFVLPWSRNYDTDSDGSFGEYQFADAGACALLRYDITLYPAPLTVVTIDDATSCSIPTVELQAANGTVCETLTGPACTSNGVEYNYDFTTTATATALAAAPATCPPAGLTGTITCAGCAECVGTYDGTIAPTCSGEGHVFNFSSCDVVPGGGGTGGVAYDYDLYIYAPGGVASIAPAGYIPNPTAGANGQFPHPNTDLFYASSTFDAGQVCTATLPGFAITNNTCAPLDVSYFLIPYDYTFDLNPDPLAGEFGFYPAASGGGSGVDEQLCQPIRLETVVYPAQPIANVIAGGPVCDDGTAMITLELLDGTGQVCGTTTGTATAINIGCDVATQSVSATFSAADIGTLFSSPADCYVDATGAADVEVYPNLTVVETPGCLPLAELTAEDGTVCDSQEAVTYDCNNPFAYDFSNFFSGAEPTACTVPPAGTIDFTPGAPPTFDCPDGAVVECAVDITVGAVSNIVTTCGLSFTTDVSGPAINGTPDCNGTTYTFTHTVTDECGNTASCDQVFTINHPGLSITCPANDIVFECSGDATEVAVWASAAMVTGGCSPIITTDFDPASLVAPCPGDVVIPVLFTASDNCGTGPTCTMNIIIQDTGAPTIACPSATQILGCSPADAPAPDITSVTAMDDCSGITVTHDGDMTSGTGCITDPFTISRTYTVTDDCGLSASCVQTIEIFDDEVPTPSCPANVMLACDELPPAAPTDYAGFEALGGSTTDNCSTTFTLTDVSEEVNNSICPEDGPMTIIRTYFIADVCGNIAACSQTYTIAEVATPTVSCPAPLAVECGFYTAADIDAWLGTATITGGCNSIISNDFVSSSLINPCNPVDPVVVTVNWFSLDECPSVGCSSTITITDDTAPTITCPDNVTDLNCLFDAPAAPNNIVDFINAQGASVSDNCSNEFSLISVDEVDNGLTICPNDGLREISRTFVISDNCGNTSSCTQLLSFADDNTDPTIQCPADQTVTCKADINPPAPETLQVTTSCGLFSTVTITDPANIDDLDCDGSTFVYTYTVTDECGRTATCDVTYTIANPGLQLVCGEDLTVLCGADDFQTQVNDWLATVATPLNACDIPSTITNTYDPALFDECGGTGSQDVTFTVTDDCGFTQSCVRTITVFDYFGPDLILTDAEVVCDNSDGGASNEAALQAWFASYANAVSADACCTDAPTLSVSPTSVSLTDLSGGCNSSLTIEVTSEDCCGRTTSGTATFTLTDPTDPMIVVPAQNSAFNCEFGNAFSDFMIWVADNGGAEANDNCGFTWSTDPANPMLPECANDGPTFVTFIATDECGNSASTTASYSVSDNQAPVFGDNPNSIVIDGCDEFIIPEPIVDDNCSDVTLTFTDISIDGCCDTQSVERTWTATDGCGQATSFTQTITQIDNTPPSLSFNDPVNWPLLFGLVDGDELNMPCDDITVFTPQAIQVEDCCDDVSIFMIDPIHQEGNCEEDGFIQKMECTWIATDGCGNESSLTIFINITDDVAPTFTSEPEDVTIPCTDTWDMTPPSAIDNCDENLVITFEDDMALGCQNGNLVTVRTWTVTDHCGNTDQVTQTITLIDDMDPFWTFVPQDKSIGCNETPTFGEPTAGDDCTDVTISMTETSDVNGCNNTYTRTWVAVDGCGNSITASQTITQTDDTAPEITAGQDAVVNCSANGTDAEFNAWLNTFGGASASDDCNEVTWSNDYDPANWEDTDCATTGAFRSVTVTFTATDACGNASTTSSSFSIADNNNPTFTSVPENMTVHCGAAIVFGTPEATDECSEVTITSEESTNVFGCETAHQITWTATDACGNTTTASQTITEVDETAPVVSEAADVNVECGEDTEAALNDWLANNGLASATDDCNEVNWSNDYSANNWVNNGCVNGVIRFVTVTFTADDGCGNASSTSATFSETDNTSPTFTSVPEDQTISCSDPLIWGNPSAADNCSDVNISSSDATSGDACSTIYTRTWTATDACGNTATASQTITVVDTEAPTFSNAPTVIMGECLEDPAFIAPHVNDNCSEVTVTQEDSTNGGSCGSGYDLIRTWTATDACGNSASFEQQVWIDADTEGPTFTPIASDIIAECNQDPDWETPQVSDNCSGCTDVTLTFNDVPNGGTCETGYDITRTWTATDCCGNSSTITQTAWVYPTAGSMAFAYIPVDATIGCNDPMLFGSPIGASTCGEFNMTFEDTMTEGDCGNYSITRKWTATDECESVATCEQMISVVDNIPPFFTYVPENTEANCETEVTFGIPTCEDECSHVAETSFEDITELTCGASYNITRIWTITDACGNTSTASQTIEVKDTEGPAFAQTLENKVVACGESMNFDVPTATDQCGSTFNLTYEDQANTETCETDYEVTRVWTATDACGNSTLISQTITRQIDTQAPVFTNVPQDVVIDCNTTPTFGNPTAVDNCSSVNVTYEDVTSTGDCSTGYTITRTWSAIDACGNEETVSQTITISQDNTLAFSNVPADQLINCSDEMLWATPLVNTNCSDEAVITFTDETVQGTCAASYAVTRTWTAEACGITVSASATISIEDNTLPTFDLIPDNKVIACGETPAFDTPLYSDNCSDVELEFTDATSTINCEVTTTRTWTIADACGNTATASQSITSVDTDTPVFSSVPSDIVIDCNTTPTFGTPTVEDNCSQVTMTFSDETSAGDCATGYTITRTWLAIDECGNEETVSQTITVTEDNTLSFSNVPADQLINCGDEMLWATPLVNTNCSDDAVITFTDETIQGTCAASYTVTRTWTAEACGISVSASTTITVEDNTLPTFDMIPDNKVISCGETPAFDTPLYSDNCSDVALEFTDATSTNNCEVTTTRTWTIADACGNTATASQSITAVDSDAPVFTSTPQDFVIDCNTTPTFGTPVVEDNCGQVNLTFNDETSAGDCATGYTVTRTWTAMDECGNDVSVSQTITVIDDTETTVSFSNVPADQFISCGDAMNWDTPAIATNCTDEAVITFTDETVDGTCASSYAVTRTWIAEACGISVSASATITVEDNTLPTFDAEIADKFVTCGEMMEFDTPLFSDNCSEVSISHTDASNNATCETGFEITRTWTIVDACGNQAVASQTVTREADAAAPTFAQIPQGGDVSCDGNFEFGEPVVTDNCSEVNVSYNDEVQQGSCENGYTFTRTWTATDACGNVATANQSFTVESDNSAPTFDFVPANEELVCVTNPIFGDATATDACSNVTVTFEDTADNADCSINQVYTRTWTAIDDCGNMSQATQVLTVIPDSDAPVFTFVPENEVIDCGVVIEDNFGTPEATDNCGNDLDITYTDASNTLECGYQITRTWSVADACGNVATASKSITIEDASQPEIVFAPENKVLSCGTEIPLEDASFTDNCDTDFEVTFEETTEQLTCGYKLHRTWTAVDNCNNVTEVNQTIEVTDNAAPLFDLVPTDQEMTYSAFAEWSAPTVTAQDDCSAANVSAPIITDNDNCDDFKYFVTWTATDDCGNATEHTMTIPITDAIMEVELEAPISVVEGTEDVLLANVQFGLAPYTYDWTILEGQGWTLDADGNLANINAGNQDATIEVKVTDAHGCSNTTIIDVAASQTTITTEFFEIVPNPTYGDLNINYTSEIDVQSRVTIYDVLGRKLHTWKFDAVKGINNNNLDVTPLADATYVITVEVGERLYHQKFVKLAN